MSDPPLSALHPNFKEHRWCRSLLSSPGISLISEVPDAAKFPEGMVTNEMFQQLYRPNNITAHITFRRRSSQSDAVVEWEEDMLLSLGSGLDGMAGRAHGGFSSLILDQVSGSCAHHAQPNRIPPATATITVDFKAPVVTPCVVLCRAWVVQIKGRKVWVDGVLEDGQGLVFAKSKSLFISARPDTETKL